MKIVAKPIDMYAKFMIEEKPVPLRFRIKEEDAFETVRVDKVFSMDETKKAGTTALIYRCQSVMDGMEKQYELRYKVAECKWDLYKI